METNHVLIEMMLGNDGLMFDGTSQALNLIPIPGGLFKRQLSRRLLHHSGQMGDDRIGLTFQDQQHIVNHPLIFGGINLAGAGGQAAAHLKIEAGPGALAHGGAAAQRKLPVEQLQGGAHGGGGGIGAEIAVAVAQSFAGDRHPWPWIAGGDLDQGVILVIAKNDVVARAMLFDQRGLQDQGLFFRGGEDGFHPVHMGKHDRGLGMGRAGEMGILAEPLAQVARLAHIQYLFFAQHLIDPWAMADRGQELGCQRRNGAHVREYCAYFELFSLKLGGIADHGLGKIM